MKVAVIFGGTSQNDDLKSFYVKDGTMYDFKYNKPHIFQAALSPKVVQGVWNYCWFWDDGCFLNLFEYEEELTDLDLDFILYANERHGLDEDHWDKYSVSRLKNKYPNAIIMGFIKELTVPPHRYKGWIRFLNECDFVMAPATDTMQKLPKYTEIQSELNKKINFFSQPVNIKDIHNLYYSDKKDLAIFVYLPNPIHRRGHTLEFANYIGKKYNIPVITKPFKDGSNAGVHMPWEKFTNLWAPCLFHFNLDPEESQQGQQAINVATVGSINIGGLNESHQVLFPETATCDLDVLEAKIYEYITYPEKRNEAIQYAWKKLNELYGQEVVKKQLLSVLKDNK